MSLFKKMLGFVSPARQSSKPLRRMSSALKAGINRSKGAQREAEKVEQMERVNRLAAAEDWAGLRALDESEAVGEAQPSALPVLVWASLELEDETFFKKLIEQVISLRMNYSTAFRLVDHLMAWRRIDIAWSVLNSIDKTSSPERLSILYGRLARKTNDEKIRAAAFQTQLALMESSESGRLKTEIEKIPLTLAEYSYPGAPAEVLPPLGKFTILARAGLAPKHAQIYAELMNTFDRSIAERNMDLVRFDNVYVNQTGQIWRADGSIAKSERPIPPREDWANAAYFPQAVLSSNATKGFFHWYAEHFARLAWRIGTDVPKIPILLGTHAAAFADETLRLAGVGRDEYSRMKIAYCDTVYVPDGRLSALIDWHRFDHLYQRVRQAAACEAGDMATPPCIYISRRDSNRRVMLNEVELEEALRQIGIEPVILTGIPLAQQVHLIAHAKFVVGAHGAGLSHIVNAPAGLKVLEIMPAQIPQHGLRFNFARISRVRGHDHTLWVEPISVFGKTWAVDIEQIVKIAREKVDSL